MWKATFAEYWCAYVPPCRPSRFDLDVATEQLTRIRRGGLNRPPRVLILGSTNEFRDWAYEEGCDVVVVDSSREYYEAVSQRLRHSKRSETLINKRWEDIAFDAEFDLAVGDLVIGNAAPNDVPLVLGNIYRSLCPGGIFLTKSFFDWQEGYPAEIELFETLRQIEARYPFHDPFPYMAYNLTIAAVDPLTNMLEFATMYQLIEAAHKSGFVSERVLDRYREFGWHTGAKISFFVMPALEWQTLASSVFDRVTMKQGPYDWSREFPVFLLEKALP